MYIVLLAAFVLVVNGRHYKKDRDNKGKDPGTPSKRQKLHNWDITILGHRGGASGFIAEHSLLSFTIGAQNGADYLEPDITFTSDGEQIIRHHPDLNEATNVAQIYGEGSDKYTSPNTIEYFWRTQNEGGPSPNPYKETNGGYFSWDFSWEEIQKIALISDDLQPSPLDTLDLKIMSLEALLILITQTLSPTLHRPIGLIPEIKYHHEFSKRLGYDVELPHIELLAKYGYLRKENDFFYVRTLCEFALDVVGLSECDEEFYGNKPAVILQSFNAPSLQIFKQYTDAPLIYLGWYNYDAMDNEFIEWVQSFANGIGLNTAGVEILKNTLNERYKDLIVYEYTLGYDVKGYMDSIMSGIVDGIWTDDSNTARVIQETLDYVSENDIKIGYRRSELLYFIVGAIFGAIFILLVGFVFYAMNYKRAPSKTVDALKLNINDMQENERLNNPIYK